MDEAIERKLDGLREGQSVILQRITSVERGAEEDEKRYKHFWDKDWAPLVRRVDGMEGGLQRVVTDMTVIGQLPTENKARLDGLWKWIGIIGGVGIASGGLGSFLWQLAARMWLDG